MHSIEPRESLVNTEILMQGERTAYRKRLQRRPEVINEIAKHSGRSLQHCRIFVLYHCRRRARRSRPAVRRRRVRVMAPQHKLPILLRLDQLVLECRPASQPVQMLTEAVQRVDCVLICLAGALSGVGHAMPAWLLRATKQPLALRLAKVLLKAREARLVTLRSFRELVIREVAERVFKQERVGEHLEQRGEGLQSLHHRILQVLGSALRPEQHTDNVRDG